MSIEVKNINKRFGKFLALDNVHLTIPDGKLIALLGPSGSGKTTLLRIIAGLETADPAAGSDILFQGKSVIGHRVAERNIGFVFQHYALFRHMNVFENIAFGLKVQRRKKKITRQKIRDKVTELIHLIQLDTLGNRYPDQLSGGQRQRVALARALAIEPQFLLLDEPFGALDAKIRQDLRRWLRKLHEEIKLTSVFVTHDQEEALELADRIVVLNNGHIEQEGTPDEVFHHPKNAFVMDFLGNVNLFHGRVLDDQSVVFDTDSGTDKINKPVFVRPHEIDLFPVRDGHIVDGLETVVRRVQLAGPVARIELTDKHLREIFVELPHTAYNTHRFQVGDKVFAVPRRSVMFEEDYSI